MRCWVTRDGKIPSNWRKFLRDNDNKTELFNFLAYKIACVSTPNVVIATEEDYAVSNHTGYSGTMQSWRSWHADLFECQSCNRSRQQSHHGQSQWHMLLPLQSVFFKNFSSGVCSIFGLPMAKDRTWGGLLYMSCVAFLQKRAKECSSSMFSLGVMFQHSVAKGISLLGKPGMFVVKLLASSVNSASIHQ